MLFHCFLCFRVKKYQLFFKLMLQFLRMKESEERGLYLSQKIKNMAYNTKFKFIRLFEEYEKDSFTKPNDIIYILGNKFQITAENIDKVRQEIFQIFRTTPWLTYRSGFPELSNEVKGSYVSDTGWGCMVRVGQMLFAQIIKHHKKIDNKFETLNVISLFNDFDKEQPFSIHKIARMARIQYGLKPGEWYNPSQIVFILGQLNEEKMAFQMKLKFIIFNSGNLFFDSIAQAMIGHKSICKCQKKPDQLVCQTCNTHQYSVCIIVLSRLGLGGPEKKYLNVLEKLMQSQFNQGFIGGKPQKALYFLGISNQNYIYLDPHFVQDAEKNVKSKQQTYFCESLRMCKNTSIDSSVGICFYLRDLAELNKFHKQINKIKTENYEDFFIFVADETPKYIKKADPPKISKITEKDDTFEFL